MNTKGGGLPAGLLTASSTPSLVKRLLCWASHSKKTPATQGWSHFMSFVFSHPCRHSFFGFLLHVLPEALLTINLALFVREASRAHSSTLYNLCTQKTCSVTVDHTLLHMLHLSTHWAELCYYSELTQERVFCVATPGSRPVSTSLNIWWTREPSCSSTTPKFLRNKSFTTFPSQASRRTTQKEVCVRVCVYQCSNAALEGLHYVYLIYVVF